VVHVHDTLVEDADSEFGEGEDHVVEGAGGILKLEVWGEVTGGDVPCVATCTMFEVEESEDG
jgi:hypothetical protein